jgi:hypothetical protein
MNVFMMGFSWQAGKRLDKIVLLSGALHKRPHGPHFQPQPLPKNPGVAEEK